MVLSLREAESEAARVGVVTKRSMRATEPNKATSKGVDDSGGTRWHTFSSASHFRPNVHPTKQHAPMRDDNDCSPAELLCQCVLHDRFCFRIEGACGDETRVGEGKARAQRGLGIAETAIYTHTTRVQRRQATR